MSRRTTVFVAIILFLSAFVLRMPGLGEFLTPDERLWATQSAQFANALLQGEWQETNVSGHPGVTTSWAGSLGLFGKWLLQSPETAASFAAMTDTVADNLVRGGFLPWLRLPVALFASLGIVIIFLLCRLLMTEATALLSAGFLLFDPFLLAHGRLLQMDALLATAIAIAWLALLAATSKRQRRYYALSGVAIGFAVATKSPALVMGPLIFGWLLWDRWRQTGNLGERLRAFVTDLLWVGLPAVLIVFLLWPAMWVAPLQMAQRVWGLMTAYGGIGHELGNFWLGEAVEVPGPLFYGAAVLWRTTPVTLIGLLLALVTGMAWLWRRHRDDANSPQIETERAEVSNMAAIFLAALWFALLISLGDKKFDRYLLPTFPMIDILAAWGWVSLGRWLYKLLASNGIRLKVLRVAAIVLGVFLVAAQATSALSHRPTYLTAYNPILGGIEAASDVILVGWGEGLEEAAAYLNQKPGSVKPRVASWYGSNVFGMFYEGESYDLFYDLPTELDLYQNDIDFVVTYSNQLQRELLDDGVQQRLGQPEYSAEAAGFPTAQVYTWPKPFAHTTDRYLADGYQLLGWTLGVFQPETSTLPLHLYWDAKSMQEATAPLPPVLAWLKGDDGEIWASTQAPFDPEYAAQVPGWMDRQALQQTVTLDIPAGLRATSYRLEMGPLASMSTSLGEVAIPVTGLTRALDAAVIEVPQQVLFADSVSLEGYTMQQEGQAVTIDLLWGAIANPPEGINAFIHVVDEAGNIIAQFDGMVAGSTSIEAPDWQSGQLLRQRAHLNLPVTESPEPYRLYVGIYDPSTGQRLLLTVDDQEQVDGRYLLTSVN